MRIKVIANLINLDTVIAKIREFLTGLGVDESLIGKMEIVVEEMYVNVCSYSYGDSEGPVVIETFCDENEGCIYLRISDKGVAFNPFADNEIDVDAKASDDSIGGLGLYMVKSMVDEAHYERVNDQNVVLLKKNIK